MIFNIAKIIGMLIATGMVFSLPLLVILLKRR